MNITFYTFSKKQNSTARPSGGTAFDVILKEGCSVQQPSIQLKYAGVSNPSAYNYAYIPSFSRYYWVTDWFYADRQWTASLRVDVLATYKTQIGGSTQYVTRAASQYDGTIIDMFYPAKESPTIISDGAAFWATPGAAAEQTFCVCTAGRGGFMDYYLLNGTALEALGQDIFAVDRYDDDFDPTSVFTPAVMKAITDPEESVCSITYLPVKWSEVSSVGSSVASFYLGFYEFTVTTGAARHITPSANIVLNRTLALSPHPYAAQRGKYLNSNGFTSRVLYVPTMGSISLDSALLVDMASVQVSMTLNLSSGMCLGIIYGVGSDPANRVRLHVSETKVGVDYGFAARTITPNYGNMDTVTGAVSSFLTGDYAGATVGIVSALANSPRPHLDVLARSGSIASFSVGIMLEQIYFLPVDDDNSDKGRPLCKYVQISTLSGYLVCSDAHLSLAATDAEHAEVINYLNGGIFYE